MPPEGKPEGRAAWQQAERHVMELHARVKAGVYGADAQRSELAILGDLNARCGLSRAATKVHSKQHNIYRG